MIIEALSAVGFICMMWHGTDGAPSDDSGEPEETISQMFKEVNDIHDLTETVDELRKLKQVLEHDIERGKHYITFKLEWYDDFGNLYSTNVNDARIILDFVDNELEYFVGYVQHIYKKYRESGDSMHDRYGLFEYLYRTFDASSKSGTRSDKMRDKISDKKVNFTSIVPVAGKGFRRASRGFKAVKIPWRK